jgi:rSAM/selenodomain-associated transferase 1
MARNGIDSGAGSARILIFAKAPQPGRVKTRLIPLLGAAGAAALHARLVERTIAAAQAANVGTVELWCAPDTVHPFFAACHERHGVTLMQQCAGNIGARMFDACRRTLAQADRVILAGSDCPVLAASHFRTADQALRRGDDAVFCPVQDGGYVLIGLARCDPGLFAGVAWSTASVMPSTRNRLKQLGWRWHELEMLWDVDRPEDCERLGPDLKTG